MLPIEEEIHLDRLTWFIRLRWWAVGGGIVILFAAPYFVPLNLDYPKLLSCLFLLGILNAGYAWYWKRLGSAKQAAELPENAGGSLHLQMFLDLVLLTLLLYFGGGTQNPFIFLYLFHLAISAIIFSESESLFYAGLAGGIPWVLFFAGRIGGHENSPWRGPAEIPEGFELAVLWAYTVAVGGLWFFLSRLAKDLKAKETKLRQSSEALKIVNEDLRHLDEYKNKFLHQVVFRLKKPTVDMDFDLSGVEKALPLKNSKALEAVHMAKKKVWSLLETIDDLTWLSRMKAGEEPMKKTTLEVYEELLKRIQAIEAEAKKKGIEFQLHGDPQVRLWADQKAFARAADQLFSNSVKYTVLGGGPVKVEFKPEEDSLVLTVQDEGIGIPAQQQKKLFHDFFRATNAKVLEESGTGLGLVIVKRILDWHGGTVTVESEAGKGTRVETRWPLHSS